MHRKFGLQQLELAGLLAVLCQLSLAQSCTNFPGASEWFCIGSPSGHYIKAHFAQRKPDHLGGDGMARTPKLTHPAHAAHTTVSELQVVWYQYQPTLALRPARRLCLAMAQGETVPYIICIKKDEERAVLPDSANLPLAQRAYHIEELQGNAGLAVDAQYYLAHQVRAHADIVCMGQLDASETCRVSRRVVDECVQRAGHCICSCHPSAQASIAGACCPELFSVSARECAREPVGACRSVRLTACCAVLCRCIRSSRGCAP